ncbi:MAG: NAD-dependent epimerase/dehydratase family protein [Jatrophihabitans sp.]|uniref:NAD-dependent epimerase/dehydratase family protein n=1 Tax=Jatrophihabitans sp. TaxID=1932789 RepID=UPI003F7D8FA3
MTVLVTGGAGYVGSHVVLDLARAGMPVVVVDDLSVGDAEALVRVGRLTGGRIAVHVADVRDRPALRRVLARHEVRAVVHLAAPSRADDRADDVLECYENDLESVLALLRTMDSVGVRTLVLGAEAAAAAPPGRPALRSRAMDLDVLADLVRADPRWHATVLHMHDVVGADPSGVIGDNRPPPLALLPAIARAAAGWLPHLPVYGTGHASPDGTGVRDYVHVADVARAVRLAVQRADAAAGVRAYELATGEGRSVHDVLDVFERTTGVPVPTVAAPARTGDLAVRVGDRSAAAEGLGWHPERSLADACRDAWRWQVANPHGYAGVLRRRPHRMHGAVHHGTQAGARTARRMSRWAHARHGG